MDDEKMKIPQRQDQVALGAPQTQAGRAVQPVEGSLGDSYITAMRGMSKSFQELSDLQFDLSKNAIQGQLDSFDIYVQARTKQYNQELSLATNQEDINKLFEQYNKDIDENGTAKLGVTLYGDWKKAKGGNTIAGAEYAGNLASAQLQIKLNQEMLSDSLQELNVLAGQSDTADERTSYINQAHELIDNNVKNGTINEAEAQKQKRQFDYDLATSLVIKDMEVNPEYVANALRTNSKYMPELKNPDRIRLAQQAEQLAGVRKGTSKDTVCNSFAEYWRSLYWENDPKKKDAANKLAGDIYDTFANNMKGAKELVAKVTGKAVKDITFEEVETILGKMNTTKNRENQDIVFRFNEVLDSNLEKKKNLFSYTGKDGYTVFPENEKLVTDFLNGKFTDTISNDSQFVDMFNGFHSLFKDSQTKMFAAKNKAEYNKVNRNLNEIVSLYVKGIRKGDKVIEATDDWSSNMRRSFLQMLDAMEQSSATPEQMEAQMDIFVKTLWSQMDVKQAFDSNKEVDEKTAEDIITKTSVALAAAKLPQDYMQFLFATSCPTKVKSNVAKAISTAKKASNYSYDPYSSPVGFYGNVRQFQEALYNPDYSRKRTKEEAEEADRKAAEVMKVIAANWKTDLSNPL